LRGEPEAKPAADRILERLTAPQPAVGKPAPTLEAVQTVDQQKLAALTQPAPAAPAPAKPAPSAAETAELAKANEKLAALVEKPK
jgi:hypothetical protein